MPKTKVNLQQIIAGALLRFKKVNIIDIKLLILLLHATGKYEISTDLSTNPISCRDLIEYLSNNKDISLGTNLQTSIQTMKIDVNPIREFFESLDMEEFVLRKIIWLCGVRPEQKDTLFESTEQEMFERLFKKGYIMTIFDDLIPSYDFEEIIITSSGIQHLFMLDNAEELEIFKEKLRTLGYDCTLIYDFLKNQNLKLQACDILTIENFEMFCNIYDRCPFEDTTTDSPARPKKRKKTPNKNNQKVINFQE